MQLITTLSDFADRLQRIIQAQATNLPDQQFAELALNLFTLQHESNKPYGELCKARGISQNLALHNWTQIPAVPTSAFKDLELSCLPPNDRNTVFHSSGTTQHRPSRHFHNAESLSLYEASLLTAFGQRWDVSNPPTIISLTPCRKSAPNSSLIYMFDLFRERFGNNASEFVGKIERNGGWALNGPTAKDALHQAAESGKPVLILGTALLHVQLVDYLNQNNISFKLPPGSHALETGGYKGRSRTIPKDKLHQLICERLGISPANIICEYGMSELSSQAYTASHLVNDSLSPSDGERVRVRGSGKDQSLLTPAATHVFHFPPWVRVQIISPETGGEVNEGETGLIRIFDLANVFSVMAIQTEDLGIRRGNGFELIGRVSLAETRGCSLMAV